MNTKKNLTVVILLMVSALARNAAGVIYLGGSITTNGDLIYNDAVVLTNNTILVSTGSGTILFNSTVNGAYSLTITTDGNAWFNGAVGGTTVLSNLSATAGGGIGINGSMVKTRGSQTYSNAVVLGADAALTSTNSGITFISTVSGDYALTVNAVAATAFGGSVSVASLTTDAAGTTQIQGPVMTTTGGQVYNDPVTLWADVAFTSTGSGNITFNSTVNGTYAMTVNTIGTTTFNGAMGGVSALDSLDVSGATQIHGDIATVGSQVYRAAVVLTADVELTTISFSDVLFNSTVNGAYSLTINSGDGVVFSATVGGVNPLTGLTVAAVGTIQLNGATITTTGSQAYNGAVVLGRDVVLYSSGAGIALNSTVNGAYALTLTAIGTVALNGVVGGADPLDSLAVTGSADIHSSAITTTGSQTYNDAVTLGANVTFTTTGTGNIVFSDTVDGTRRLTLNAADSIVFNDRVGAVEALSNLTASAGGTIWINGATVETTGSQTYNDPVVLGRDVALTSTGAGITFISTVNGNYTLTLNAAGGVAFNSAVGGVNALNSLAVTGAAQIHDDVLTMGSQSYNSQVAMTGGTTLQGDPVEFSANATSTGSVAIAAAFHNGGFLAVNGDTLSFLGVVTNGGTIRAYNGAVLNFSTTVYNGGVIDALAGSAIFGGSFFNSGLFVDASSFVMSEIRENANDVRLTWATMGGHEYVLQAVITPWGGSTTNVFRDVSPILAIAGQSLGVTNYLHVGSATNLPSRCYRVRLQL